MQSTNTYSATTSHDVYYSKYTRKVFRADLYKVSSPLPN